MFVQEEKIFAGKVLRLHICASDGAEWLEEATEDTSVEKLKERCLKHVRPGPLPRPQHPPPTPAPDASDCGPRLSPRTAPAWGPPPSPQLPGPLLRGWRQRLLPGRPILPLSDPTPLDACLGPGRALHTPASQLTLQLRGELGTDRETEAWRVESLTEQGLTTFQQLYLFAVGVRFFPAASLRAEN